MKNLEENKTIKSYRNCKDCNEGKTHNHTEFIEENKNCGNCHEDHKGKTWCPNLPKWDSEEPKNEYLEKKLKEFDEKYSAIFSILKEQGFKLDLKGSLEYFLTSTIQELQKKELKLLERLKLEFDTVVCECGDKWKDSDGAELVKEALKALKKEL